MTLEKIIEFQKKSAEVLAEMISELDESELNKLSSATEDDKNKYIAQFRINVSKFSGTSNRLLGSVAFGNYDSEMKVTFYNYDFDYNSKKGWKLDEVLSKGAECLRG